MLLQAMQKKGLKKMYKPEFKTITVQTKKEQLIEEMVSCYNNGESMFELAEEYFKKEFNKNLKSIEESTIDNLQDIIDVPAKGFFIMCEIVELSVKTTIESGKIK